MTKTRRTYQRILIAAVLLAGTACATAFHRLTPEMVRTDLEGVRKLYYVPSLGVAEVTVDDITAHGPVGKGRIDGDVPVTPASLYQLGSCTKAMTATALEKLMQDGTLSWNTKLLDIFPEFAATADISYQDVTLGDIASHQAGFRPAGDVATWDELRDYPKTRTEYLGEKLQESPRIRRGRYLYSNIDYAALGAVIERRTGLSYPEAMNKLLFDPLGVKAFFAFPKDFGADQPRGYTSYWGAAAPARAKDQLIPGPLAPAGVISMTLRDYARFVQLHLRGMLGQDDAGYTPQMIKELHEARIRTGLPFDNAYAAGWVSETVNNETIHWHTGSAGNFFAIMAINPARRKGIVVVTNVAGGQSRVCWDIMERMLTGRDRQST